MDGCTGIDFPASLSVRFRLPFGIYLAYLVCLEPTVSEVKTHFRADAISCIDFNTWLPAVQRVYLFEKSVPDFPVHLKARLLIPPMFKIVIPVMEIRASFIKQWMVGYRKAIVSFRAAKITVADRIGSPIAPASSPPPLA